MTVDLRRIRKSMVMQWKRCPKMYEDFWIKDIRAPSTVEQEFGIGFHSQACRFFKELDYDQLTKCKTKEAAYDLFVDFLPEQPVVREWMQTFLWFEATLWERQLDLKIWKPIATELELESDKLGFWMHIDRIDRMQSGYLIDIDYKTGKYMNLADLRFELTYYAMGINSTDFSSSLVTYGGCYNPTLKQSFVEEIKPRTVARVMKTVAKFRQANKKGVFPPKPQFLCRYCQGLEDCIEKDYFSVEFLEKMNAWGEKRDEEKM
jgi:hypothetical protein